MVGLIKAFSFLFPAARWFRNMYGSRVSQTQGSSISYRNATAEMTRPKAVFYDISGN
jgi:hypothetical protein